MRTNWKVVRYFVACDLMVLRHPLTLKSCSMKSSACLLDMTGLLKKALAVCGVPLSECPWRLEERPIKTCFLEASRANSRGRKE